MIGSVEYNIQESVYSYITIISHIHYSFYSPRLLYCLACGVSTFGLHCCQKPSKELFKAYIVFGDAIVLINICCHYRVSSNDFPCPP